jgi:hypothetical protein
VSEKTRALSKTQTYGSEVTYELRAPGTDNEPWRCGICGSMVTATHLEAPSVAPGRGLRFLLVVSVGLIAAITAVAAWRALS